MEPTPKDKGQMEREESQSRRSDKSSRRSSRSRKSSRSQKGSPKRSVSSRKSDREETREKKDFKTLYVNNLKKDILDVKLEKLFAAKGEIERVKVLREPQDNMCRGYAFITFKNSEDAQKALEDLNQTDFEGQKINIEISKRSQPRPKTPGTYRGRSREEGGRGRRSNYDNGSQRYDRRRDDFRRRDSGRRDDRYGRDRHDDRRREGRGGDRRRDDRYGGGNRDRRRDGNGYDRSRNRDYRGGGRRSDD